MLLGIAAGISSVAILFQDYGQQPKTQEGELKISAVFSVSGSPLGKDQDLGWVEINRHFVSIGCLEKQFHMFYIDKTSPLQHGIF